MDTPICDFVRSYAQGSPLRLHMPGHKGNALLGMEALDITEIPGADSLYEASGIIIRSEENASSLFGCPTFYSTEGSSLCIRAMLLLAVRNLCRPGEQLRVLAGRNAHKTFLTACGLLDIQVDWLPSGGSYLSSGTSMEELEAALAKTRPHAVYLTSPDYLGGVTDIAAAAQLCRRHGALLMVDNAHGAYLRFLQPSRHPMDLGADMCCDSAHKTLPALTGGAYLHLSPTLPPEFRAGARNALAMFGSTSPSYLILQSLDAVNDYIYRGYSEKLAEFAAMAALTRQRLQAGGYTLMGDEPLKLTLAPKAYGYTGDELGQLLRCQGIECEFSDPDYLVLMMTPETGSAGLSRLERELLAVPRGEPVGTRPPEEPQLRRVMSIREAVLAPSETLPVESCLGRVLAEPSVGCPPAVPIAICGEELDSSALARFEYYGISTCTVVK